MRVRPFNGCHVGIVLNNNLLKQLVVYIDTDNNRNPSYYKI